MKILTILGCRPDIIKLSEIIKLFDKRVEHILVHTGQNHDKELSDVFFDDLDLRKPNYYLGVAGDSLGKTLGKLMQETELVLQAEKPDAVVILGDTNSALSSIIVKRFKIPLFHLEAGNRSFDDNVPEEINRRVIDHISDINLVYTEHARRNLLNEGLPANRIYKMGSPMFEVIGANERKIRRSKILKELGLKKNRFYLMSIHRDENIEIKQDFVNVIIGINLLAEVTKSTIVLTMHPRLKNKLAGIDLHKRVLAHKPFGFLDYCKLQASATCVISDSGTIAEESSILNFPAVTVRNAMERPEAIDAGSLILAPPNSGFINAVAQAKAPDSVPEDYLVYNCAERVLRVILGYTNHVNRYVWHK